MLNEALIGSLDLAKAFSGRLDTLQAKSAAFATVWSNPHRDLRHHSAFPLVALR